MWFKYETGRPQNTFVTVFGWFLLIAFAFFARFLTAFKCIFDAFFPYFLLIFPFFALPTLSVFAVFLPYFGLVFVPTPPLILGGFLTLFRGWRGGVGGGVPKP